ncbi:ArsR family transcriptional regulator [Arthrobacter sp. MYb211]|uniref:Lrp/AsnC family transcriptional regulator n=1 Tax=Glutamicibacter sp. AOP12-B1-11 TaxID=3457725 RepID=UPI000CFCDF33|nr:ArsR family transcriptional regulator [Arthrobacter sp. MYb224]PQZ98036.1 ArsR family transcriptional regulator [Arthrobacter sp. MYb229]PRA10035.1 ArsR family transcriptional regulator [Arthrobacter sp. MYb221]PRB46918.1 ArsR family transcriptional regulator [Arthrobacter sp. MYb216]PRC05226.1 ArsR family transcriptional regulator [Arthrobacter sp. MYb211]
MTELSTTQRRIIAALQVDGRATWRKIATVLDIPERSVARHGAWLLESGVVTVAAVRHREHSLLIACTCAPGTGRLASEALSSRSDTSFSYQVTGREDLVVEMHYDGDLTDVLSLELPATPGVSSVVAYPVLKYFKTVRGWRLGSLNAAEENSLRKHPDVTSWKAKPDLVPKDQLIISSLREDGRASIESIARRVAMSETSVARRIDWLLASGQIAIRALVEPSAVGLPTEALLWVSTSPIQVEQLGQRLARRPEVRYAAAVAGDCQLVVNVTVASQTELYDFISNSAWGDSMLQVKTSFVVKARKRGGRLISI